MEIKYNIEKSQRKALAQKIAELTGAEVRYLGVPGCAYEIDFFTLSKDAVLSFSDRSDTEIVEAVLDGIADAGFMGEVLTYPVGTATNEAVENEDAPESNANEAEPVNASISFPISEHTVQSITNLICMIHSRGSLLSKATGGHFFVSKELADAVLSSRNFQNVSELTSFIAEWNESHEPLTGISFDSDKLTFEGFGESDAEHIRTFMKLSAAMNRMALTQHRIHAKNVDDSNEKYTLRVWLIRLGMNGSEYKDDRKRLLENLSGHSAFRNDAERERWETKQQAKRDAQKFEPTEEDNNDAVSE